MASGLAVGLLILAGSGSEDKATKVDTGDTSASGGSASSSAPAQAFKIGDVVKLGDAQVIVHGVKDPFVSTNQFSKPAAGSRYVTVDTEVKNLSKKPASYSSIAQFKLQDSTNQSFNVTIVGDNLPSLDGEAPVGGGRRGTLAFEVPTASKGLKLAFKGDIFGTGTAYINLS